MSNTVMCTLSIISVVKSNLFIRALLLDRILVTEKNYAYASRTSCFLLYYCFSSSSWQCVSYCFIYYISVLCFIICTICSVYINKISDVMDVDGMKYGPSFYLGIVAMVLCVVDIVVMFVLKAALRNNQ